MKKAFLITLLVFVTIFSLSAYSKTSTIHYSVYSSVQITYNTMNKGVEITSPDEWSDFERWYVFVYSGAKIYDYDNQNQEQTAIFDWMTANNYNIVRDGHFTYNICNNGDKIIIWTPFGGKH